MLRPNSRLPPFVLAALAALAGAPALGDPIVVEEVDPAVEAADLHPGDELVSWRGVGSRSDRSGDFERWWQLEMLIHTELAAGPVEILLVRDGSSRTATLPWQEVSMSARPRAPEDLLRAASPGSSALEGRAPAEAEEILRARGADDDLVLWSLVRTAGARAADQAPAVAMEGYRRALGLARAPFSAELARRLGVAATEARDFEAAEEAFARGLEIWSGQEDGALGRSALLSAQGDLQGTLLRTDRAQDLLRRACDLRRREAPGSWFLGNCLNNLGIVHGRRNDLATAEALFLETLELDGGLGRGRTWGNLAIVSRLRGDFERAELYIRRAIDHYRETGELAHVARQTLNLANIVADSGDLERARGLFEEALAARELIADDDTTGFASIYLNRGMAFLLANDLDAAERDLERARRLLDFEEPRTSAEASVLGSLGEVDLGRGNLERAIPRLHAALAFWEKNVPDSSQEAKAASSLGRAWWRKGDPEEAEAAFRQSVRALERQQGRTGGGDRGLVAFRTKFAGIYRTYVDFLLERGREVEAFELDERARAQALRALLDGRDLEFAVDDESAEIELERRQLGRTIEGTYRLLARLQPDDEEGREKLRVRLEALHAERDALSVRLHAAAPRSAAAEVPPARTLDGIREALPEGTLLLVFDLGARASTIFAVDRTDGLTVHRLDLGRSDVQAPAGRWVELVNAPRPGAELDRVARELSDLLLRPVAGRLARADRLVVVPDGPLHAIAFAALPDPNRPSRYLVERLPIGRDVSASVHTEPRDAEGDVPELGRLAIFGDPATSAAAVAGSRRVPGRLPASRLEAEALGELFGDRAAVYLDERADEATARAELERAAMTHFACHAIVEEQLPLDSALLLADRGDGGLLQAWEIAEQLEIASNLVVLSACETARGGGGGSEGIVGLVRSLQIAGADSVIASLWRVRDESAAALMVRFYRHLADGGSRAEALRAAQLELLAAPIEIERDGRAVQLDLSSPRHWAPFVLVGRAGGRSERLQVPGVRP